MPARSGLNSPSGLKGYDHLCISWPELLPESYTLGVILQSARSRQRGIATTEVGIVSVILLILGILFVRGCAGRSDAALQCVTLAAAGSGVQGLSCPVTKAPFLFPVCPDPDRHLRFPPRFERDGKGPARSRQDLPTAPGTATLDVGRKASYIAARENGPTLIVDVRPRIWWRYIVGPIVQLLCLVYIVAFFFQLRPKDRGPGGIVVMSVIAALVSGWLLWITVPSVEGSHAFQIDPSGKRVIRHRYLFGKALTPVVYETEFAPVFVRTRTGWSESYSLVLVHDPGSKPHAIELIEGLSEEDAVLGSWLRARLP